MIKLIDLRSEVEKDVQFGTCELCFYTSDLEREFLIFQDDTGQTKEIATGYFSWGEYELEYSIDNIPRFAEYILERGKKLNFSDFDEKTCPCGCKGYVFNFENWLYDVYQSYKIKEEERWLTQVYKKKGGNEK